MFIMMMTSVLIPYWWDYDAVLVFSIFHSTVETTAMFQECFSELWFHTVFNTLNYVHTGTSNLSRKSIQLII